ncbi:rRNA maturation RNase YbeY [Patescibacteria group bacterium]|nr:rRNA maturation RNase YbeY [Patescibacteria group bacterium]
MAIAEYNNLTIIRQTKGRIPILPFVEIKNAILGTSYELSLVFPTLQRAEALHIEWKKKPDPVNILSFPLDDDVGEIIITLQQARREARQYGRSYHNHLIFLFIHGCLHLKGMTHGVKMEQRERLLYKRFAQS